MRSFMLVKKDDRGKIEEIAGPCIEQDVFFDDRIEVVDECIFKTLHPEEYRKALVADLPSAVATWLEMLYENSGIPFFIENEAIHTDKFTLQITPSEIHVMLRFNCPPAEAARLVLYLHKSVFEDIAIVVTEIPMTQAVLCDN